MTQDTYKCVALLVASNTFMTMAWYGHLKFGRLFVVIAVLASWSLALFEYALQVPGNRIGHRVLAVYELKVIQEAITLIVFVAFAWFAFGERLTLRYALSFALIFLAVVVTFVPWSS